MKQCCITLKKNISGNNVSHSNIKTKRKQKINLMKKKIFNIALKKWMRIKITAKGMRTFYKKYTNICSI